MNTPNEHREHWNAAVWKLDGIADRVIRLVGESFFSKPAASKGAQVILGIIEFPEQRVSASTNFNAFDAIREFILRQCKQTAEVKLLVSDLADAAKQYPDFTAIVEEYGLAEHEIRLRWYPRLPEIRPIEKSPPPKNEEKTAIPSVTHDPADEMTREEVLNMFGWVSSGSINYHQVENSFPHALPGYTKKKQRFSRSDVEAWRDAHPGLF